MVLANKINSEKQHEDEMKTMIERINAKQKNSQEAYQKNLSQKVQMAKDSNSKMEAVAQRAK